MSTTTNESAGGDQVSSPTNANKPVVSVVHGTFEPHAPWTRESSPLLSAVAASTGATIFQFQWTGKNTFEARQEGVASFEEHVASVERLCPGTPHFVIAHSHGGSLLTYWLKRTPGDANANRIAGIAFLSTPFIAVRPAGTRLPTLFLSVWAVVLVGAMAFGAVGATLCWMLLTVFDVGTPRSSDLATRLAALGGGVLALVWYVRNRRAIRKFVTAEGRDELAKIAQTYSTCNVSGRHHLFLKTTGDEVISALGTAQFLGLVLDAIQSLVNRAALAVPTLINKLAGVLAICAIAVAVTWYLELPRRAAEFWHPGSGLSVAQLWFAMYSHWWSWPIVAIGAMVMLSMFAVVAVWLTNTFAMRLALLAFGGISAAQAAFLELSVEPTPQGSWTLEHVAWDPSLSGLHHSESQLSPEAIKLIVDWMQKRLNELDTLPMAHLSAMG